MHHRSMLGHIYLACPPFAILRALYLFLASLFEIHHVGCTACRSVRSVTDVQCTAWNCDLRTACIRDFCIACLRDFCTACRFVLSARPSPLQQAVLTVPQTGTQARSGPTATCWTHTASSAVPTQVSDLLHWCKAMPFFCLGFLASWVPLLSYADVTRQCSSTAVRKGCPQRALGVTDAGVTRACNKAAVPCCCRWQCVPAPLQACPSVWSTTTCAGQTAPSFSARNTMMQQRRLLTASSKTREQIQNPSRQQQQAQAPRRAQQPAALPAPARYLWQWALLPPCLCCKAACSNSTYRHSNGRSSCCQRQVARQSP